MKTNEPILVTVGTRGPQSNDMKCLALGFRRSKFKAEDRFAGGGISVSTPLSRVGLPVSK